MAEKYFTVSWEQLHRDSKALAWRLMGHGPFTGIVAITRGGLIPAAIIARELECRLVETVSHRHLRRGGARRAPGGEAARPRPGTAPAGW